jgi:hypothetical protein
MAWNYRVVRFETGHISYCQIHEVYYDEFGNITAVSEDGISPYWYADEDGKEELKKFYEALDRPELRNEDMPKNEDE